MYKWNSPEEESNFQPKIVTNAIEAEDYSQAIKIAMAQEQAAKSWSLMRTGRSYEQKIGMLSDKPGMLIVTQFISYGQDKE